MLGRYKSDRACKGQSMCRHNTYNNPKSNWEEQIKCAQQVEKLKAAMNLSCSNTLKTGNKF